jgi:hypothetical protein
MRFKNFAKKMTRSKPTVGFEFCRSREHMHKTDWSLTVYDETSPDERQLDET